MCVFRKIILDSFLRAILRLSGCVLAASGQRTGAVSSRKLRRVGSVAVLRGNFEISNILKNLLCVKKEKKVVRDSLCVCVQKFLKDQFLE